MAPEGRSAEPGLVLDRLRAMLVGLVGLGLAGALAELLLIGHYEDSTQVIPLVVLGVALATVVHRLAFPTRGALAFRAAMVLLVAGGLVGIALHHRGGREFQQEVDPSLRGLDLVLKVMHAKTPPALAPGNMVLVGLLGLASVYKVPAGDRPAPRPDETRSPS
jgi:hypothetical protein